MLAKRHNGRGKEMPDYMIESPHTREECAQAIEETLKEGEDVLKKFAWGCMSGDHTAYAMVSAGSEMEARNMVPSLVRGKARVVKVDHITPDQVRAMHKAT